MPACLFAHHVYVYSALGDQQWVSDPLSLESQAVSSYLMWVLGTEPGTFERAPRPRNFFFSGQTESVAAPQGRKEICYLPFQGYDPGLRNAQCGETGAGSGSGDGWQLASRTLRMEGKGQRTLQAPNQGRGYPTLPTRASYR